MSGPRPQLLLLALGLGGCHLAFPLNGYADAGTDGGNVTPGDCTGAFLCDGFEGGLGAWDEVVRMNGTLRVVETDTARAHRGASSLHTVAQGNGGDEVFAMVRYVGSVPRRFHARVFVYVAAPAPAGGAAAFVAAQESGPTYDGTSLSLANGRLALTNWGRTPANLYLEEPSPLPTDRWVCLEWMVDGATGESRTWVDDTELSSLRDSTLATPPYSWFRLGLDVVVEPGVRYELWLDDLYVGSQPVGCSR